MYRNLTAKDFSRQDEADDANFYAMPRMVIHLDDKAVSLVKDIARRHMPPMHVRVLDLMSSFRSHLPEDRPYREVIGLGMNQSEMQANPQLTRFVTHDLNRDPQLPFSSGYFDVVINTVSIQYLTQPVAVYREVTRVLRPAGVSIVIFSDRMFPTKAVRVWREGDDDDHVALVQEYHRLAGNFRKYSGRALSWREFVLVPQRARSALRGYWHPRCDHRRPQPVYWPAQPDYRPTWSHYRPARSHYRPT